MKINENVHKGMKFDDGKLVSRESERGRLLLLQYMVKNVGRGVDALYNIL